MLDARKMLAAYEREQGIFFPEAREFLNPDWADNFQLAMDAQPELVTTPSSGIPAFLTAIIDPQILRIRQANNNAALIFDEVKKGTWVTESAIFPVVERGGNVTSYGDFENGGSTTANANFETRQPYLFQAMVIWGELQLERAGLAKISWATELQGAAADVLGKFENLMYFKGVAGLQNYGIQNDPSLLPAIAPAPKANGGFGWLNGATPNATANEIYADLQAGINTLIAQSVGNIDTKSEIVIALSPRSEGALTATNAFGVNVMDLVKKNYPNVRFQNAIQYGVITPQNPQGVAAGEMIQFIALRPGAQDTGWLAFNEKLRAHRVVADVSSFKQKMTSGAYGAIIRQPFAIATMIGI
jgi:hypothetical protein